MHYCAAGGFPALSLLVDSHGDDALLPHANQSLRSVPAHVDQCAALFNANGPIGISGPVTSSNFNAVWVVDPRYKLGIGSHTS